MSLEKSIQQDSFIIINGMNYQWNEVKQLEKLLRHPFLATKQMQSAHLTPGSFYKERKTLIFKLSHIGGKLADAIRASMQHREAKLMNNDVILSSIYVDPKHRIP